MVKSLQGYRVALLATTILAGSLGVANAATITLYKGGAAGDWATSSNWTAGLPTAALGVGFNNNNAVQLKSASESALYLTGTNTSNGVDLHGYTLTLDGNASYALPGYESFAGKITTTAGTGTLSYGYAGAPTTYTETISGPVTQSGTGSKTAVSVAGGALTLSATETAANTFSGGLTVSGGVFNATGAYTMGSGGVTISGGAITTGATQSVNKITESGGSISLTGGTTSVATTTGISGGSLDLSGGATLNSTGAITNAGTINTTDSAGAIKGALTNSAPGVISFSNTSGTETVTDLVSNDGTINVAGKVSITGDPSNGIANTGAINVTAGSLTLLSPLKGTASSSITVGGGASAAAVNATKNPDSVGTLTIGDKGSYASSGVTTGVTVYTDYVNNNAGVGAGNSYAPLTNVTGKVNANTNGLTLQTIVGDAVVNGGTNAPTLTLGHVHVVDNSVPDADPTTTTASQTFAIMNTGSTSGANPTPTLRGAVNTSLVGSSITVANPSSTDITANGENFGPLATGTKSGVDGDGGKTGNYTVSVGNVTTAGAITGTVQVVSDFSNISTQKIAVTGAAYRYATGSLTTSSPTNSLGAFYVGTVSPSNPLSGDVTVTNTAANDGYSESLDVTGASTSDTVNWSISSTPTASIAAQNADVVVAALNKGTLGVNQTDVNVGLQSDGNGTSGLGTTTLPGQTITVNAEGYQAATPALAKDSGSPEGHWSGNAASGYLLEFTGVQVGQTVSADIDILNQLAGADPSLAAYIDLLGGSFSVSQVGQGFDNSFQTVDPSTNGIVADTYLDAGSVSYTYQGTGTYQEVLEFDPTSYNVAGLTPGSLGPIYVTVDATTAIPEPSTWAMLGLGFAGLSFAGYRRSRRSRVVFD